MIVSDHLFELHPLQAAHLPVLKVRCICSATAAPQEMGVPMKQADLDSRLERDVVSAVLHLREHGWALIDDVISR